MRANVVVLLVGCAACGEATGLREREHAYTIRGGEIVELKVELSEGAIFVTEWTASATLVWQLHGHPLGMLQIYEQGTDANGMISFTAVASGVFGVQWSHFGDPTITLDVMLGLPPDATLLEW